MCAQAALDRTEGTKPSNALAELPQAAHDASKSDSTAAPRKLKQKKIAPVPAAQLLEDEGLNAELDAANAGGLVETERDRLIRTVRKLLSTSTYAKGPPAVPCVLCRACACHPAAAPNPCQVNGYMQSSMSCGTWSNSCCCSRLLICY